jgi:hypothetical protein
MTFYGAVYWHSPETCLDEAFDAPDIEADQDLCRAIAAGRWGLHPDAWGNHDPLPLRWLLRQRRYPPVAYEEGPPDLQWEAKHRRRPVEESPIKPPRRKPGPKPKPPGGWPPLWWEPPWVGTIQLTCDECDKAFGSQVDYGPGEREVMAAGLRAVAWQSGWTHIDGRDLCPECSTPEDVGNGAGERQGDKQYTNGG